MLWVVNFSAPFEQRGASIACGQDHGQRTVAVLNPTGVGPDPNRRGGTGQFKQAILRADLRLLLHRCWFLVQVGESTLLDHEAAATSLGPFEQPVGLAPGLR